MEEIKIIRKIPIKIAQEEVYRYLGAQKESSYNTQGEVQKVIREEIELSYPLMENKGIYRFLPIVSTLEDGVIITGQGYQFSVNKKILHLFQNSQYLLFAITTIGPKIEQMVKERFKENQYLKAMVLDAVGTVAVKTAGQWINHFLEEKYKEKGFQLSRYFEPGSSDWDIKEQEKVFAILKPERIGVTLNNYNMMQPAKSLSWIRGMGQNLGYSYRDEFSCDYCTLTKCPFRKNNLLKRL